jgi:hypothetical protein
MKSLQQRRACKPAHLLRIACHGALGDMGGAGAALAEFGEVFPKLAGDEIDRLPFLRDVDRAAFARALEQGGLRLPR